MTRYQLITDDDGFDPLRTPSLFSVRLVDNYVVEHTGEHEMAAIYCWSGRYGCVADFGAGSAGAASPCLIRAFPPIS